MRYIRGVLISWILLAFAGAWEGQADILKPKILISSSLQTPSVIHYLDTPSSGTDAYFTNNNGVAYLALPETNIAGQTIVVALWYQGTSSSSVTFGDDKTNTWTKATHGQDTGNGYFGDVWIAPNILAGTRTVQITNSGSTRLTNWCAQVVVLNNIVTSSPLDGTNTFNAATSGTMSAGNITPSQAGDFFVQFARVTAGTIDSHQVTAGAQANTAFELITANQTGGYFMQGGIYSVSSTLNPQMTVSPSATYLSMAIALKASSSPTGGTPSGMYVVGIHHEAVINGAALIQTYQWPARGNLLVNSFQTGSQNMIVTNAASSASATWTEATGGPSVSSSGFGSADWWFATNMTKTTTLLVTNKLKDASVGHGTYFVYDIAGARTTDPIDFRNSFDNTVQGGVSPGEVSGTNVYAPYPILPSVSGGIVLAQIGQDNNTAHDMSQTGWLFDATIWAGNNVSGPSQLDQNNGWGHYHPNDTTNAVYFNWNYQWTDGAGFYSADAIHLLPSGGNHVAAKFPFLQSTNAQSSSATTITKAFPANTTAGKLIVVGIQIGTTGRTITVTNTQGNTFFVGSTAANDGQGDAVAVYYATNITGGASTIGVHVSGAATFMAFCAMEYDAPTTITLDKTAGANSASTAAPDSGTVLTTAADELLVGVFSDGLGSSSRYTANPGWSGPRSILTGTMVTVDRVLKAVGTVSAGLTIADATPCRMVICTFK